MDENKKNKKNEDQKNEDQKKEISKNIKKYSENHFRDGHSASRVVRLIMQLEEDEDE